MYVFKKNNRHFEDISGRDQEVRQAIEYLANKEIINGFNESEFRPDRIVNRSYFVAFVMRALGRVNNFATTDLKDVESWCYPEVASGVTRGYVGGYADGTFRGSLNISKTHIYAIFGRILAKEKNFQYNRPEDPAEYLASIYVDSDEIPAWARADIALAETAGLVVHREDRRFAGNDMVDRGDAALIILGLYEKIK